MRCRRLCETKPSGRCHVDANVANQYKQAGESREVLEMALLECLAKHGLDRSCYKRIKAQQIACLLMALDGFCSGMQSHMVSSHPQT